MTRSRLQRRYLSLGLGELVSTTVFVLVTRQYADRVGGLALWSALIPLAFILIQAGCYWLLARRWVGRSSMPLPIATVFRSLRMVNLAVLAAGLLGMIVWFPDHAGAAGLALVVWCFGVLEYVNYYVVRLAYPVGHWLPEVRKRRIPRLVQDMQTDR